MTGSILQINVSPGGVPKFPIREGRVTRLGIEGDGHRNPEFHGGPTRALLLICSEVIESLIHEGYPLFYGALGENITTRGIDHLQMRTGQRYRLGEVVIELTRVRTPCTQLDVYGPSIKAAVYDKRVKAEDPSSPRWAMSGFYSSVVQTGVIRQDDIIALVDHVV
jgi:MOSC domain-containing protein YiiM